MSFGKAFGFSILSFIGLNVLFFFIGYGIDGWLPSFFALVPANPAYILLIFLGPISEGYFPYLLTQQFTFWVLGILPVTAGQIILFIGYIVAPIIAAFLSGRFGENKREAFLGWFLTAIISALTFLIVVTIQLVISGAPYQSIVSNVIMIISIGLVYGLACGCIALLIPRESY